MSSSSLLDDTTPDSTPVEELPATSNSLILAKESLSYITGYRAQLMELEQKTQDSYDKTLLTLSSSALGLSFAFVTEIVPIGQAEGNILLLIAWGCWGVSLAFVLFAYYMSRQAFRDAIKRIDNAINQGNLMTIYQKPIGGRKDQVTSFCNATAGILFLAGVAFIIIFVSLNII